MVAPVHAQGASFRPWLKSDLAILSHRNENENIVEHTDERTEAVPVMKKLVDNWNYLYNEPFRGITNEGGLRENVYAHTSDDGIDINMIVEAGNEVLSTLTPEQQQKVRFTIKAQERRSWSNPHMYVYRYGIRLEDAGNEVRDAVLALFKVTMSPQGYEKMLASIRINEFLGQLVNRPKLLNRSSYNFLLFGEPSTTEPWGWLLNGHHLCLSFFVHGKQMVISPTFVGAEPNYIDEGPYAGTRMFIEEDELGLHFMQDLPSECQAKAQIYEKLTPPGMPMDRYHPVDQRLLCGAFRDNKVVPYEGVCLGESALPTGTFDQLLRLIEHFIIFLPDKARQNRLAEVAKHKSETYFCWIGQFNEDASFYYRIQNPVIICEFDHRSGVFLGNPEASKFHTHTVVRTPNGGDYGWSMLTEQ